MAHSRKMIDFVLSKKNCNEFLIIVHGDAKDKVCW